MASLDAIAKRYQIPMVCGLLAAIAYLQGSGIGSLIAEHLPVLPTATPASLRKTASTSLPTKSGATVLSRNPFDSVTGPLTGKAPPAAPTATPLAENKPDVPACPSGNVVLITNSPDPDFSFAVITTGSESKMRRVGDEVGGRTVEAIHDERVVLAQGTSKCQLRMHETSPKNAEGKWNPASEPSEPKTSSVKSPLSQGIRKVSDTEYVIEEGSGDKLAQLERALRSSGRLLPGGGLKLQRAAQSTVLGQLGLKKDDVIKSINGADMADLDASMTAYAGIKSAKEVSLVIERDGKPITMDYRVK